MEPSWLRYDDPGVAVEKILSAAEKAYAEVGVSKAGMATIAEFAGCSRGTLYRYFKTRHELHIAYINRVALEIQERIQAAVKGLNEPRERLVETILCAVREVRQRPGAVAWFEPGISGATARMSRSSEVIGAMSASFVGDLPNSLQRSSESRFRARWVLRVILSLLSNPAESEAEERIIVERFAAPGLLSDDG